MNLRVNQLTEFTMNFQVTIIALAYFAAFSAPAADLTTTNGRTFRECKVLKVSPDGVTFRHEKGMAKVLFSEMTDASQQAFGYDPQKEKAHQKQVSEERAKKKEVAKQRAAEATKAYAEAQQQAVEYQTLVALQQSAAISTALAEQQAAGAFYGVNGVFAYPGYGYYGRDFRQTRGYAQPGCQPGTVASRSVFGEYGALVRDQTPVAAQARRFAGSCWSRPTAPARSSCGVVSVNSAGGH